MSKPHPKPTKPTAPTTTVPSETLRERILADFAAIQVPLPPEEFDAVLAQADRERLSHLEFLQRLIAGPAACQRERSIAWRVKEARFKEPQTFATFDWLFNA